MVWYLYSLGSAAFSATAAVLEKKVLLKQNALFYSFVLSLFNVLFALPFLYFIDFSKVSSISLWVLLFKSFLGALSFLFVMKGLKNLQIGNSLPLLVLTPGIVAIFAFFFLGEILTIFQVLGLVLLLVGSYIVNLKSKQKILDPLKAYMKTRGHHYIGIALFIFSLTSILDKVLLAKYKMPPTALLLFQNIFLSIFFLLFVIIVFTLTKSYKAEIKSSYEKLFKSKINWKILGLICLTGLITIVYRYTHILAVKTSSSVALALGMKRFSVFFAVFLGKYFFKEDYFLRRAFATLVMIAGAALIIL